MDVLPSIPLRALETIVVLLAGPISYFYGHHQPMPLWFNQSVFMLQLLATCWFAVTRCGGYLPPTPFDLACDAYLRLWEW